MIELDSLNENQREAVEWREGPLLVLAGPGSGKTRVLTYRIASLLEQSPGERFRILGITFTNKAAAEMRERLDELISDGRDRALLTTFHSFAAELLRQHGSHIGLQPDFSIQSQPADRQAIVSDAIELVGTDDHRDDYTPERALKIIDALLDEGVAPTDAEQYLRDVNNANFLVALYGKYFASLTKANQQDFGSLIVNATLLLRDKLGIAKQVRRIYKHFCVDEFQDTNAAQYNFLMQLLPPEEPNLFVVADDDQVIYQWNGANPKRLAEIRSRFHMTTIQLPQNYRCPKEVIDLANLLIQNNLDRTPDKRPLTTSRKPHTGEVVRVLPPFTDENEEVAWVRTDILTRPIADRPKCVVLARTRKMLDLVVADCNPNGLPAYVSIKKNEFQSAPMRWLHATLRLANARTDKEQLRRVCKSFYQLEGIDTRVESVVAAAPHQSGDFLRSWLSIVERNPGLSADVRPVLQAARVSLLDRGEFSTFIVTARSWFAVLQKKPGSSPDNVFDDYDAEAASWTRLVEEIYAELGRSEVTLSTLLQGLDLRSKEPPTPKGAVRCYTIHSAKGMEFEHVYLLGMAEDQLPSWAAVKKGDDSLEMREERRNCFVAITRTQQTLTMTYALSYNGWAKNPSRFLKEMKLV